MFIIVFSTRSKSTYLQGYNCTLYILNLDCKKLYLNREEHFEIKILVKLYDFFTLNTVIGNCAQPV